MKIDLESYEYYYHDEEKILVPVSLDMKKENANELMTFEYYKKVFKSFNHNIFHKRIHDDNILFSTRLNKVINKSTGISIPAYDLYIHFEIDNSLNIISLELSFSMDTNHFDLFRTFYKDKIEVINFSKTDFLNYNQNVDNLEDKMACLLAKLFFDMHNDENEDIEIYVDNFYHESLDIAKPYKYFRLMGEKEIKNLATKKTFK
ncbi:hypothetical protein UFVDC4_00034 [Staphylococcus phage vB_SauM-UFV_DC4]|nr:hypothetical protein UFVDC4_00034 [Staphylococcus phage vB_SauM-UFV_DC4]